MVDTIVTIQEEESFGVIHQEDSFSVCTTSVNPAYVNNLSDIGDVDIQTNGKLDGSVLVYKAATNKWTTTQLLNQQIMDAGEF